MADLIIKNGRIVTPSGVVYGGIVVEEGIITYVGSNQGLPPGRREIDAKENFVIPGLIDPHVHMGAELGVPFKEEVRNQFPRETEGALHGGVTTFGHMMVVIPQESNLECLEELISAGEELSYVDFFSHGTITSELHLNEQPELWRRGVTSFKHFWNAYKGPESMGVLSHTDESIAYRSLLFNAEQGYPAVALFHCEEMDPFYVLAERLQKEGRNDLKVWSEARPAWIETKRMLDALLMAKGAGSPPIYIVHMSCAEAADMVTEARRDGYPIWGETCPAYLTHTCEMENEIGCWGKVNTSLKYAKDNERLWLWQSKVDGGVTNIGTDHCAFTRKAKEEFLGGKGKHGNIWKALPGLCGGMEHLLPVMMTFGVHKGRISIEDMVRVCSTNTAKVFGLYPRKGILAPGSDADIVLVDPNRERTVDSDFYHCRAEFSIYEGFKFRGLARTTIIRGEIMMEDYETIGKAGYGRYIPRPV